MMPINSNDGSEKLYEYMYRNRTQLKKYSVLILCFKLLEFYTYAYAKNCVSVQLGSKQCDN